MRCLTIADIAIFFNIDVSKWARSSSAYSKFIRCAPSRCDISLLVHYGKFPKYKLGRPVFTDRRIDAYFYHLKGKYIFKTAGRLMVVDAGFSYGDIYVKKNPPVIFRYYPLQHPLDKLLILNLLSRKQGVMLHACGIKFINKGLLFVGTSGAGKSTIARLWHKNSEDKENSGSIIVLNDDRVIIRKKGKRFWLFGTPWHGELNQCSPQRAPIEKIFFLRHAQSNYLKIIPPAQAAARLLNHSLAVFWNKQNMESALVLYSELLKNMPCYELGFVPDKTVLDFIKNTL